MTIEDNQMKHRQEVAFNRWTIFSSVALVPLLLLTSLVLVDSSDAQMATDMPIQFKIRGEFYNPQENPDAGGVNRFTVHAEGRDWILDVERADTLEGSMLGSSVLKKIYPPIMTFAGPPEIMAQLKNPEIQGKSYTMTGQLYVRKRLFRLTSMVGNEEQGEAGTGSEGDSPADKSETTK